VYLVRLVPLNFGRASLFFSFSFSFFFFLIPHPPFSQRRMANTPSEHELDSLLSHSEDESELYLHSSDKLLLDEEEIAPSLEMQAKQKTEVNRSFFCLVFCLVSQSVDYAVIMPSLWLFLRSLDPNIPEYWLGITLSSFSLVSVLLSPFFGYWCDKRPLKEVLIFQLWIACFGNLLYSFSSSVGVVILSRAICGVGSNMFLVSDVYVIRSTSEEERTSYFTKINLFMTVGLILGPVLNYPISLMPKRDFGIVQITPLNVVGLLMAVVLLTGILLVHFFFKEPKIDLELAQLKEKERHMSLKDKLKSVATIGTMSLAFCTLISSFNQIALEASIAPITLLYWDFGQLQNSIFYAVLTVYLLVWYMVIAFVFTAKFQIEDRKLLLTGWIIIGVALFFQISTYFINHTGQWYFWQFVLGVTVVCTSIPFFDSATSSLFSKLVPDPTLQGRAQSILSTLKGIGILLGPVLSAPLLTIDPLYLFVLVAAVFVVSFPLYLLSFKHLKVPDKVEEIKM
jgi:MFS family permease